MTGLSGPIRLQAQYFPKIKKRLPRVPFFYYREDRPLLRADMSLTSRNAALAAAFGQA